MLDTLGWPAYSLFMPATNTATESALINAFAAATIVAASAATVTLRGEEISVTVDARKVGRASALASAKLVGPCVVKAINETGALAMWKKGSGWVAGGYTHMGMFYTTSYTRTYIVRAAA